MKTHLWLAGLLILGLTAHIASAQIGIHFPSDRDTSAGLLPDEVAGIAGAAQGNWNWADGGADAAANASGTTADIVSPNAGVLTDGSGAVVGTTVEWTSNGTWNTTNGTATPDAKLMNGYIDAIGADAPVSRVTFNDIPYDEYSAVVYFGSDGNGRTGELTDGTTTFSFSTFSNDPDGSGGFDQSDYVLTADSTGNPESNYAIFSNLSGSSWSVEVIRGSNNSGIHGVQIVPEPSTIGMFALAAFGLLVGIRRRR